MTQSYMHIVTVAHYCRETSGLYVHPAAALHGSQYYLAYGRLPYICCLTASTALLQGITG